MNSMLKLNNSSIIYRHVKDHERQQALEIWCSIFKTDPDSEERYFLRDASPFYQEGDTLGAWHNGKLISTVHIRRLKIRPSDKSKEYLCGGITNVVTLAEYRQHGISRHLLQMAVDKMEQNDEFDISMLGTSKPSHFSAFGWEQVPEPIQIMIDWKDFPSLDTDARWYSVSNISYEFTEILLNIYSNNPRIYQMNRSPLTVFQNWVKGRWQNRQASICLYEYDQEQGYVVIGKSNNNSDVCILEWRASSMKLEQKLLSIAAAEILQRHGPINPTHLFALPQYMTIDELTEWAGHIRININQDIMMRNIRLSVDIYEQIKAAYADGRAVFWSGDYF